MRFEREFRERCAAKGEDPAAVERAWRWIGAFDEEARIEGFEADDAPPGFVEAYLASLFAAGLASEARIRALATYALVAGSEEMAARILGWKAPGSPGPAAEAEGRRGREPLGGSPADRR